MELEGNQKYEFVIVKETGKMNVWKIEESGYTLLGKLDPIIDPFGQVSYVFGDANV